MEVNMQNKIILIDPQEQNYPLLKRILNEDYVLAEITDIRKINDFLTHDSETIAAILADYPTLRSQKFTLAKMIRQNSKCDRIPLLAAAAKFPRALGTSSANIISQNLSARHLIPVWSNIESKTASGCTNTRIRCRNSTSF